MVTNQTNWKNLPWTNELGQPTHIIKRTGVQIMIHMENLHTGELTCLTGNEYPVFLKRCEIEAIK